MKTKFLIFLLCSAGFALPALADQDSILTDLQTNCYDVYAPRFEAAVSAVPNLMNEQVDFAALLDDLPEGMEDMMGFSAEDLAGLNEIMEQSNELMAPYVQQAALAAAQVRIDLAQCYVDHTTDDATLHSNAQRYLQEANQSYQEIQNYDYASVSSHTPPGTTLLTVAPGETKQVRVRAFCLDSGRGVPGGNETYYLAGSINDLQGEGICDVLKSATSATAASEAQAQLWESYDTSWKPSSDIVEQTTEANEVKTTISTMSNAVPNMIGLGMITLGSVLLLGSLVAAAAHWLPKPVWIVGCIVGAGLAAFGGLTITSKTTGAQAVDTTSLFTAQQQGNILIEARAPGTFSAIDVAVTNLSDTTLTLDMSCLTFIPKGRYQPEVYTAGLADWLGDDFDYNPDTPDNYGESNAEDAAEYAQRLGTGEIIDDNPPPFPWWPPVFTPEEEVLDLEELQNKVRKALDEAIEKLKQDPTEDNLEEVMKERARCQATGCNEETDPQDKQWKEIQDAWQKAVDKAVENYKNNPSDLNREELERATELGQLVGADTDAAVEILQNAPIPDLVG